MPVTEFKASHRPVIHHGQNASAEMMRDVYCVYEHHMTLRPGAPPDLIFVGYCKLGALFEMREARSNSEWARITNNGRSVVAIGIVAICNEMTEANKVAMSYMASLPTWPHCNQHGYNLERQQRRLLCSDGRQFESQDDAARAIGVSSSAISQHLRGKLKSVKGLHLEYLVKVNAG